MIRELQSFIDRRAIEPAKLPDWVPVVLGYYRQVEVLAASSTGAVEDALRLAEEASQYVRDNRIKGICVADDARQLAALLDRRTTGESGT